MPLTTPETPELDRAIAPALVGVEPLNVQQVREIVRFARTHRCRIISQSADPVAARQAVTLTSARPRPVHGDAPARARAHRKAADAQLSHRLALADAIPDEHAAAHAAITWLTGCSLLAGDIDFATGEPRQAPPAAHRLEQGAFDVVIRAHDLLDTGAA